METITYRVDRQYEGLYYIIDSEDSGHVASVGRWMPGPMIHMRTQTIVSTGLARALAEALVALADELDNDREEN